MPFARRLLIAILACAGLAASACSRGCDVRRYSASSDRLYAAGLREYQRGKWENAVTAFDRLTTELSARETLLSRAY